MLELKSREDKEKGRKKMSDLDSESLKGIIIFGLIALIITGGIFILFGVVKEVDAASDDCCKVEKVCGDKCCDEDEECIDDLCCPEDRACGDECCHPDMPCIDNRCCPAYSLCGDECCQYLCCDDECCIREATCCDGCCFGACYDGNCAHYCIDSSDCSAGTFCTGGECHPPPAPGPPSHHGPPATHGSASCGIPSGPGFGPRGPSVSGI